MSVFRINASRTISPATLLEICGYSLPHAWCRYVDVIALLLAGLVLAGAPSRTRGDELPRVEPEQVGMRSEHLARMGPLIERAIQQGDAPGCVVAVGRHGRLAMLQAFGNKRLQPTVEPMTVDTLFDMASITKPVATATSVMLLIERGQLRLRDRVADHLPSFGQQGKRQITVQQLLTHHGGLVPDNPLADYLDTPALAWQRIDELAPIVEPGTKFIYTDVGFLVLGRLVEQISGTTLDAFTQNNIFQPLGMEDTGFRPGPALRRRAAPTEQRDGQWIQGEVHDPRSWALDGVAGHAGLFSTANDMALFADMMLRQGRRGNVRILSPRTVSVMTRSHPVSGHELGLGWNKQSSYSSNRSELFSHRAFGHGGFTGTVLWMDPELDLFFVFLSNRLHPDGKGSINVLAGKLATIAAASIDDELIHPTPGQKDGSVGPIEHSPVETGLDVLRQSHFASLAGQRVGLITNHTSVDQNGDWSVPLLHEADQVNLVALFSPEHGIAGRLDVPQVADGIESRTGIRIYSLYGTHRAPTAEQLAEIDTLVFDIQDIGTRFYTYISTLGLSMEQAAKQGKRFVVLDRPNPINGIDVQGPVRDENAESFTAYHTLPVRHGLTVGELARMFKQERKWDLDLQIIPVRNWHRAQYFDGTGLLWVDPSPNMRRLTQAILYPGIGLLETTNISVGRGTDTPFEWIGAPWLDAARLVERLNNRRLSGATFVRCRFTPSSSVYANELCQGVQILLTDRSTIRPIDIGLAIAIELRDLHSDKWQAERFGRLLANQAVLDGLLGGSSLKTLQDIYRRETERFRSRRAPFLLY